MLYYKSFNTQPKNFKKINNYESSESENSDDETLSSSSCSSESSEDDRPSPKTPKRRNKYASGLKKTENVEELRNEIKHLQRKLYKNDIELKKLKSKV